MFFPEDEVTTKEELEQVVPIVEKLGAKTTSTDTTGLDESLDVLVEWLKPRNLPAEEIA